MAYSDYQKTIIHRNNVNILGKGDARQTLMLAHGFGCNQDMWRYITPQFSSDYRIVLFDYVGSGHSDFNAFSKKRYENLQGYAQDVLDICLALQLENVVFVGHSVSSVIGMLSSVAQPHYFSKLIQVCPSPCFLNFPPDYFGGFEKEDLEELINLMDKNYIGWAEYLAPLVMGADNQDMLIDELERSFCSTDPKYAKCFAQATFFSDFRSILPQVKHPTLILQSADDSLASVDVGRYMHNQIPHARLEIIDATGHCLHMTNPDLVKDKIKAFLLSDYRN